MGRLIESIVETIMNIPPVVLFLIAVVVSVFSFDLQRSMAAEGTPVTMSGEPTLVHVGYGLAITMVLIGAVRIMGGSGLTGSGSVGRKRRGAVDVDSVMSQLTPGAPGMEDRMPLRPIPQPEETPPATAATRADPSSPLGKIQARATLAKPDAQPGE